MARQVVFIAITESESKSSRKCTFQRLIQNLELGIYLTPKATPANVQAYCDRLMNELDKQHVMRFEKTNLYIRSDYDLGVIVNDPNKV